MENQNNELVSSGQRNVNLQDINAQNININTYNTLPTEKKNKIDQQIYLKCDRVNTINDLKDILEANETFTKPVIIFLPGFLDDEHNLAVKKMNFAITSHFETPTIIIKSEDWDTNKNKDKQLKRIERSVRETFENFVKDKKIQAKLPDKIENGKIFSLLPLIKEHILIFEQEIDLEFWSEATYLNLCHLLRNFWNFEIDENSKPVFVIYSLVFGKTKSLSKSETDKIINDMQKLSNEFNIENMELFEELSEINRGHIKRFFDDCDICDAEDFMQEGETRRMRKVLPELRKVLLKRDVEADDNAI